MAADSLHDCTDRENVKDAERELLRAEMAGDEAALAAWARAWGRPAVIAIEDRARDPSLEAEEDRLGEWEFELIQKSTALQLREDAVNAREAPDGDAEITLRKREAAVAARETAWANREGE